jgi:hypothetical protein
MRGVREWPVLIGYGDRNVLDPLSGRPMVRQGWNAVVWPVRIEAPPPGAIVTVPSGFARVQYSGQYGSAAAGLFDPFVRVKEVRPDKEVVIRAQLPEAVRGLKNASATLTLRVRARSYQVIVQGLVAATKKSVEIARLDRPREAVTVAVPSADAYATADGAYVFMVKFNTFGGEGDETLLINNTFEGADVDLKGTIP